MTFSFKLLETSKPYYCGMTMFFTLLGVALLAYRVFVKGETIIVKNPNWKLRGLACLIMGLSVIGIALFGLIGFYIHHVPILNMVWVMLAAGIIICFASVHVMRRPSSSS